MDLEDLKPQDVGGQYCLLYVGTGIRNWIQVTWLVSEPPTWIQFNSIIAWLSHIGRVSPLEPQFPYQVIRLTPSVPTHIGNHAREWMWVLCRLKLYEILYKPKWWSSRLDQRMLEGASFTFCQTIGKPSDPLGVCPTGLNSRSEQRNMPK